MQERVGDSRYFARENENNEDLFTVFADYDMHFIPSSGKHEDTGIAALDEWFAYNPDAKLDKANSPVCYIDSSCKNLIDSLLNYSAQGKSDEPLKDFFDLMRYLRMMNAGDGPDHYGDNLLPQQTKKGGY